MTLTTLVPAPVVKQSWILTRICFSRNSHNFRRSLNYRKNLSKMASSSRNRKGWQKKLERKGLKGRPLTSSEDKKAKNDEKARKKMRPKMPEIDLCHLQQAMQKDGNWKPVGNLFSDDSVECEVEVTRLQESNNLLRTKNAILVDMIWAKQKEIEKMKEEVEKLRGFVSKTSIRFRPE